MEERIALLREFESGAFAVTELCARHGISRDTFYVWKRRRDSGAAHWFEDRSHATRSCPHATAAHLEKRIIAARERFDQCRQDQAMIAGLNWVKDRGRTLGIISAPNFFVNARLVKSFVGLAEMRALIDAELAGKVAARQ